MKERTKIVGLGVSTIWALRQRQAKGESLDDVLRRIIGLPPVPRGKRGPAPSPSKIVPRGRVRKYAMLDNVPLNEFVTIPWQLDERGQIIPGQRAAVAAIRRVEVANGWRFVEQSGSGQGTRWLRIA